MRKNKLVDELNYYNQQSTRKSFAVPARVLGSALDTLALLYVVTFLLPVSGMVCWVNYVRLGGEGFLRKVAEYLSYCLVRSYANRFTSLYFLPTVC